jgi:cysteinyl-tRNA synthetase
MAVRYFILTSHYRSVLDFSDVAFEAAEKGLKKLHGYHRLLLEAMEQKSTNNNLTSEIDAAAFKLQFKEAMNDDFNTPKAIAALHTYLSAVTKVLEEGGAAGNSLQKINKVLLATAGGVLGILQPVYQEQGSRDEKFDRVMDVILHIRQNLRKEKHYQLADSLRDDLSAIGITVKDTPEGTVWEIND